MPSRSSASTSSGTDEMPSAACGRMRRDLVAGHALAEQLARAAVARVLGQRGGHQVARAGQAQEGLGARAVRDAPARAPRRRRARRRRRRRSCRRCRRRRRPAWRRSWPRRRARRRRRRRCARRRGRPCSSTSPSWSRSAASVEASTTWAPRSTDSAACDGPPRKATARALTRSADVAGGQRAERLRPAPSTARAPRCGRRCARRPSRRPAAATTPARRSTTRSTPANSMSPSVVAATLVGQRRRRAGSRRSGRAAAIRSALAGVAAAELHVEPRAREQRGDRGAGRAGADDGGLAQRRQAAEPLLLELDARPDAGGHLGGERLRRLVDAREGERAADAQLDLDRAEDEAAARALGAVHRDRDDGRAALERQPADAALGLARARRVRMRVPSGKITTASPRSSSMRAVFIDSSSDSPRRIGNAPRQLRNQPIRRFSNSSCLATK